MTDRIKGYSSLQIALHWIVVVLVSFQFLAHDGIETAWRALRRDEPLPVDAGVLTYMHIATGILILVVMLTRIYLRVTRGAPRPPADEPWPLKILAEAVHVAIYGLLLLLPVSGMVAWFFVVEGAANAHEIMTNLLLAALVLHVSGALFQHVVMRSDVVMRMLRPQRD